MADDITWTVTGLDDLEKALLELEAETGIKTLRSAGRKAMVPVHIAAVIGANEDTGELRESIAISSRSSKHWKNQAILINVGPTRKSVTENKVKRKLNTDLIDQKAIAQEYGTEHQQADPFLRPALDQNADRVLATFKSELSAAIARVVRKQQRSGA